MPALRINRQNSMPWFKKRRKKRYYNYRFASGNIAENKRLRRFRKIFRKKSGRYGLDSWFD